MLFLTDLTDFLTKISLGAYWLELTFPKESGRNYTGLTVYVGPLACRDNPLDGFDHELLKASFGFRMFPPKPKRRDGIKLWAVPLPAKIDQVALKATLDALGGRVFPPFVVEIVLEIECGDDFGGIQSDATHEVKATYQRYKRGG